MAKAVRALMPYEDIIYIADSAYTPYGDKCLDVLTHRVDAISDVLLSHRCKAIVVACNTATVNTISRLREKYTVPFVGVEPGIKPAAQDTHTGNIGVLATANTLASESFQQLITRHANHVNVHTQACPKFVALVEAAQHNSRAAAAVVEEYLTPLLRRQCDQIVLGCTHFSFLLPAIEAFVDGQAHIVDTALPVAKECQRRLAGEGLLQGPAQQGANLVISTDGNPAKLPHINDLWGVDAQLI